MTAKDAAVKVINKQTLVPLSLVAVIGSCIWWAATANSAIRENTKANIRQDKIILETVKIQAQSIAILEMLKEEHK